MGTSKLFGRLALAGWIGAVACGGEEAAGEYVPCTKSPRCYADPVAHWVCIDDCRTDADCPGGFVCVQPVVDAMDQRSSCQPPTALQAPTSVLIEGFGVARMTGKLDQVEAAEGMDGTAGTDDPVKGVDFTWKAPDEASVVQCALFVCAPVIEHYRIVNYDQCVVAEETYAQREGAFSLYDADLVRTPPAAGICDGTTAPTLDTEGRFAVTELLVGCWAYDQRDLVAATKLERPSPSDVFNFHDVLANDPECSSGEPGDVGRSCVLGDGTYGVCTADGCARRCLYEGEPCGCDELGTELTCGKLRDAPEWAQGETHACLVAAPGSTTTTGGCDSATSGG